jgi:hypothetical protein
LLTVRRLGIVSNDSAVKGCQHLFLASQLSIALHARHELLARAGGDVSVGFA